MKVLIIPCRENETPAELYSRIYDSVKLNQDIDGKGLATHIRRTVQWAEVTKDCPYVEVKVEEKEK